MGVRSLGWLVGLSCVVALACGDSDGSGPGEVGSGNKDGGEDAAVGEPDAMVDPTGGSGGSIGPMKRDAAVPDAGVDAAVLDAGRDASGVMPESDAGPPPVPEDWTCPDSLWNDVYCDCGCGAADRDCVLPACTTPGCIHDNCDACFSVEGEWKPCEPAQDPSQWSCAPAQMNDSQCDCGCTIDDPTCNGSGCSEPGCRKPACRRRHGCDATQIAAGDDCSGNNSLPPQWYCPLDLYSAGNGCDCGCGGIDPDCGTGGCAEAGCNDAACDRCTDATFGMPRGCGIPGAWISAGCAPESFGTGDGCDCGCGADDPDCAVGEGCVGDACTDSGCEVCHDSSSAIGYVICDDWTCTDADAFANAECDCGCGVVDPFCRDIASGAPLYTCTEADCETEVCEYCNDASGARTSCGGGWNEVGCGTAAYGLDGRCDCGCGAVDPDCAADVGCTEPGCEAPGCEVCHGLGMELRSCYAWSCEADVYGDGTCDCGCGARDIDCGAAGNGCREPGCRNDACQVCHDPLGRAVPCP